MPEPCFEFSPEATRRGFSGDQPCLYSGDLLLRPFRERDAPLIARNCAPKEIAAMTRTIPHPYRIEDAHMVIEKAQLWWKDQSKVIFAICPRSDDEVYGAVGLSTDLIDLRAEVGYNIGMEFWNQGIASRAVRAVLPFGFQVLCLRKICAHYLSHNPASGKVLAKCGFVKEGTMREQAWKWGEVFDLIAVGLLRQEWAESSLAAETHVEIVAAPNQS